MSSWDQVIQNMLFNYSKPSKEEPQKFAVANNVLIKGGIFDKNTLGPWATKDLTLNPHDIESIVTFSFKRQGSITIGDKKYLNVFSGDKLYETANSTVGGLVGYFKCQNGGCVIAFSKTACVIGVFDITKQMVYKNYDGVTSQKSQNQGNASTAVEAVQKYLLENNM